MGGAVGVREHQLDEGWLQLQGFLQLREAVAEAACCDRGPVRPQPATQLEL